MSSSFRMAKRTTLPYRIANSRRRKVDTPGCNKTWLAAAVFGVAILAISLTVVLVALLPSSSLSSTELARMKDHPNMKSSSSSCAIGETFSQEVGMCLPHVITPSAVDTSIINYNISACEGFFEHACGKWVHAHQNEDRAFTSIAKRNHYEVDRVVHKDAPHGIGAFFDSCASTMVDRHSGRANPRGERTIYLKQQQRAHLRESALERNYILAKMTRKLVTLKDVPETLALMTAYGFTIPFHLEISNHPTRATMIPTLQWDGFVGSGTNAKHAIEYHFRSMGHGARHKTSRLQEILNLLALHRPSTDMADMTFQQYVESGQLQRESSQTYHEVFGDYHLDFWNAYMRALARYTEVPELESIVDEENDQRVWTIGGAHYFRQLPTLALTVSDWRLFIEFSVLAHTQDFFPALPSDVYYRHHQMLHVSQRMSSWLLKPKDLDKREQRITDEDCKRGTQYLLPGLVAKQFLKQFVPKAEETRERVTAMVESIRDRYSELILETDWMDNDTRARAAKKIAAIIVRVVHPNQWDAEPFGDQMDPERYLRNLNIIRRFRVKRNLQLWATFTKRIAMGHTWEHHFDRDAISLFGAPLSTVNAWYSPVSNTITVFAGILRHPFYHEDYDDVSLYAGIGMVIGHELAHSMDNSGRMFDAMGSYHWAVDDDNWWSARSRHEFARRANLIAKEYSQPIHSVHHNGATIIPESCATVEYGQQTLGEDLADIIGIRLAYEALLHAKQGNLSEHQKQYFFYSFSQNWCSHYDQEHLCDRVGKDVHAIAQYRVDKTLRHTKAFQQAFQCQPGESPMAADRVITVYGRETN